MDVHIRHHSVCFVLVVWVWHMEVYLMFRGAPKLNSVVSSGMCFMQNTFFLRSDTMATIYFAAHFVRLLFEGGIYFFGKPGDIHNGWIR